MRLKFTGFLVPLLALLIAAPAGAQVVINEILPNPGSEFDGAEFIELHNTTGSPVSIAGWVIGGSEFDSATPPDSCTNGEDLWQIPAGETIPANGYVVIAKDNIDLPPDEDDGYLQRFGSDPDFEMYDATFSHETDDPNVTNLTLIPPDDTASNHDDQIGLIPGSGNGVDCGGTWDQYDMLKLWNANPRTGGSLIDAIEWRDATTCAADGCAGVNGVNDAFVGLPGVGESLGRDASGTDTNDCSADLYLGTPTPGAANIANVGPDLSLLRVATPAPKVGESSQISITATDPDGIGLMELVYRVNGGSEITVTMVGIGGNNYAGTIPSQANGAEVSYYVRGTDSGNAAGTGVSKYPDYSVRQMRWGTQTIISVQSSAPTDTAPSPLVGKAVNLEGIVTAERDLFNEYTFVIQSASGFFNGVHCFDVNAVAEVRRGDLVRVAGVVQEYFNLTEIVFFGEETAVEVISSGNALPGPDTVVASDLTTGLFGETWEGCYVTLDSLPLAVTNPALGFGEWQISDASGSCRVDDAAFYNYSPALGDSLDEIQGIVTYTYDDRKLEPRDDQDILGPPLVYLIRYSPICPSASDSLVFSAQITDNGSITRAKFFYSTTGTAPYDSVDMVDTGDSLATWATPKFAPFTAGTEIDYHIEITDDAGFAGRGPSVGDYDMYVGEAIIETIQTTFASGTTDSSAFAGSPRNVGGIVTMAPGVLADNVFTIQNHWTTDPANRAIQVYTGGNVVGLISEGDSICVSGDVAEYYGKTQIDTHWTLSFVNHGFVGTLPAYELLTSALPVDSTGAVPTSEPWESVLVQMTGSIITNADAGFGQFNIDNTPPRNGFETLVDDEARYSGYNFTPVLGDSVTVRGTVDFLFGEYKIQPRGLFDILPYDPADAVDATLAQAADLSFALHQNAPNPVQGPITRISFAVPRATQASLRVYDVTGRLVTTLLDGKVDAGAHTIDWDGRNGQDRAVSAGVYFYRLQADGKEATKKMIFMR